MKDPKEVVQEIFDILPEDVKEELGDNVIERITQKLILIQELTDKHAKELGEFLIKMQMHRTSPDIFVPCVEDILRTVGVKVLDMLADKAEEEVAIHEAANQDPKLTGN